MKNDEWYDDWMERCKDFTVPGLMEFLQQRKDFVSIKEICKSFPEVSGIDLVTALCVQSYKKRLKQTYKLLYKDGLSVNEWENPCDIPEEEANKGLDIVTGFYYTGVSYNG